MELLQQEILLIIAKKLGNKFVYGVSKHKHVFGNGEYFNIWFACSNHNINGVSGQKVQAVSLMLDLSTLELKPQVFGGNGGQSIYRKPNMNDASEKYLAMKSVKIPFRTPTKTEAKVKECIGKFVDNYIKVLKENKDVLQYQDIVDYNDLLKHL